MAVINKNTIILAVVTGLVWSFCFYYIRKGLNPDNTELSNFKNDAIFGGIATVLFVIINKVLQSNLNL